MMATENWREFWMSRVSYRVTFWREMRSHMTSNREAPLWGWGGRYKVPSPGPARRKIKLQMLGKVKEKLGTFIWIFFSLSHVFVMRHHRIHSAYRALLKKQGPRCERMPLADSLLWFSYVEESWLVEMFNILQKEKKEILTYSRKTNLNEWVSPF